MKSILAGSLKTDFVDAFPGDHSGSLQPRQTPGMLYSDAVPSPVAAPKLLAWSDELGSDIGVSKPESVEELAVFAGNGLSGGMRPYAACYGGHQFGNWAGQLGDGRAITLGEWVTADGSVRELQLKGAGPTAYSRRADGRAVLRSSLREYLMSEAMHYLRVPTTRALSLVSTGDRVIRDMFYDGHPEPEPGAIVMRVAPSFLRFGNFEILASRGERESLQQLVDWTIDRFYPEIGAGEDRIVRWFREIVRRTAALMSEWMRVGFVHGVMNTDNMSILGLTIDYGPYSFLDNYDPDFTPNTTDLPGRRYAFARQPAIGKWNLACLAGALSVLMKDSQPLSEALQAYDEEYGNQFYTMMARKLGFDALTGREAELIDRLQHILAETQPDMTLFFRRLIDLPADISGTEAIAVFFSDVFYQMPQAQQLEKFAEMISDYNRRRRENAVSEEQRRKVMQAVNPHFIPRNYLLQQAIEGLENGKPELFERLQQAIRNPYGEGYDDLVAKRPDWAMRMAGCSMLSCSS